MIQYAGYPHYSFVQDFELGRDRDYLKIWFEFYRHFSLYFVAAYLITIFVLREYMKNRSPLKLRKAVLIWDIILAVFSVCGMLRTVPELLYILKNFGLEFSVCDNTYNPVSMFWGWVYALSKVMELLDTIFLVLKKQKLTFLHVSHHALTLIVTWYWFSYLPAMGRWMGALNYSIHAFMYSYFALKMANLNINVKVSMIITMAQIAQFGGMAFASMYALRAHLLGHECKTTMGVAIGTLAFTIFLTYLFVNFFLRRYSFVKTNNDKVK